MSAAFILRRYSDPSGVSGLGIVAHGVEWDDGAVALHWPGEHPSTAIWGDMRDMEATHGHQGKTVVEYSELDRLIAAYEQVTSLLLRTTVRPTTIGRHPDHPDRLRVTFSMFACWDRWVSALGGSLDAATHVEVDGEMQHRWVSSDGNLWLIYHSPIAGKYEHDPIHDPRD